jgi:small subunit ribosomal protein S11
MGKKRIISKDADQVSEPSTETVKKTETKVESLRPAKKGIIFVNSTFNNTIIQAADEKGNILASASTGSIGFSGTKKSTPYAASKVAEALIEKIKKLCPFEATVKIKGIGRGRETALRSLITYGTNVGLTINTVYDVTPLPHNGPKPPKARRT